MGVEAHGVIAIGQMATGVVAIGQLATGVIAIGQVARGVVAFGQLAMGVVAAGQLGIGVAYGAGMLGVGGLAGGLFPVGLLGTIPFTDAIKGRWRAVTLQTTRQAWGWPALAVLGLIVWLAAFGPLWSALFDTGGVLHHRR